MAFILFLYVLLSALVTNVVSRSGFGLHLGTHGLLQTHPFFSGKGIRLYPAHSPDHSVHNLDHLAPKLHHEMYYSQEGHRPALHGAKHANMKANFSRPTIVFDHTSHLRSIQCGDGNIRLCFTPEGFEKAQETWTMDEFNLITYHVGCGDETSGMRSYFLAKNPDFNEESECVEVATTQIEHGDAIESGEISWGTYQDPEQKKRVPVKGHVHIERPTSSPWARPKPPFSPRRRSEVLVEPRQTNDTDEYTPPFPPGDDWDSDDGYLPVNLTNNLTALVNFFGTADFDTSDIDEVLPWDMDLDFIDFDGEVWTEDEDEAGEPDIEKRRIREALVRRHRLLKERGIRDFFEGVYNGAKKFVENVATYVKQAVTTVANVTQKVVQLAVVAAKVIAVPFGVPFDESYKNDYNFTHVVTGSGTNRPPQIFGYTDGFNLAGTGGVYSIQCAKCGVHGEFSVEGRLAFNVRDGISEGYISLINNDAFVIDAIFGITLEVQYDKPIEAFNEQIASVALSPFTIPGIITLGPQLSISGALDLVLNGKANLLIGGSLSIGSGTAQLSLTSQQENKLDGFQASFHPVAKFSGSLTASVELGLPIALEVGLDVLNGKFKKTVGLVNKPSVYGAATVSLNLPPVCQGVLLSVGVKNRIYVQAIGLWDYDIRTDIIYEQALGCVTSSGFNSVLTLPDPLVLTTVPATVGGDIANIPPNITDVSANLTHNTTNGLGYRVVMDQDKTSILVSGRDGYIYLVQNDEAYDLSAPWGSVNLTTNALSLDVFGRILAYISDTKIRVSIELKTWDPAKIPRDWRAAAFTLIKQETTTNPDAYTVMIHGPTREVPYYTTFCKTPQGLRLNPTYYLIDKDGRIQAPTAYANGLKEGIAQFGVTNVERDCRTVWLTGA